MIYVVSVEKNPYISVILCQFFKKRQTLHCYDVLLSVKRSSPILFKENHSVTLHRRYILK